MHVDDSGTIFLAEQLVTTVSFRGPSNPFHAILCAMLEVILIIVLNFKNAHALIRKPIINY